LVGFRVPQAGLEPALAFAANRILSPACLPIPPPGHLLIFKTNVFKKNPIPARAGRDN
jgi:hypothetical protein